MAEEITSFNAFGLIRISPKSISVSITALFDGRRVPRSVIAIINKPVPGLDPKKLYEFSMGAQIIPGQKTRFITHEHGNDKSNYLPEDFPQVAEVVEETVGLILKNVKTG